MVRPVTVTIDAYIADQTKIANLDTMFAACNVDDSLRKLSKKELFKNATLLQTNGSDLMGRVSRSLKGYGDTKVNSEKNDYNSLQRFAYRIAGVFKRGVFATKGEAAQKLSKKITAVQIKVDIKHPGGLMAKIASITVRDHTLDNEKLKVELEKLRDKNFSKLFSNVSFSATDVVNVMKKYENLDVNMTKEFISEVVKTQPDILVSEDMLDALNFRNVMQNHIADCIVDLSEDQFIECVTNLQNLSKKDILEGGLLMRVNAEALLNLIVSKASPSQKAVLRKDNAKLDAKLF